MSISAVGCTPLKPKVSFGAMEEDKKSGSKAHTYKFGNHEVRIDDVKEPLVVFGQVAGMSLLSYFTVQCAVTGILARFAPKASVTLEKGIRNVANSVRDHAQDWSKTTQKGIFSNIKKYTGIAVSKIESTARSIYNGIANWGLSKSLDNSDRVYNSFGNIAGTGVAGATFYKLCTKDEDKDGIKDIWQQKHSLMSQIMPH